MSEVLQALVIILMMGAADRVRGDKYHLLFDNRLTDKLVYGWLVAALMGHPWDIYTLPAVLALIAGSSWGWGAVVINGLGLAHHRPDVAERMAWWQKGVLKNNVHLALLARGAMWGACFLPIAYFNPVFVAPAIGFTLAFPIAVYLARIVKEDKWEYQELFRGWIAGLITFATLSIIG